jgi:hypothetical protein
MLYDANGQKIFNRSEQLVNDAINAILDNINLTINPQIGFKFPLTLYDADGKKIEHPGKLIKFKRYNKFVINDKL